MTLETTGPLVDPADVPTWLAGLVEATAGTEAAAFTRLTVPDGEDPRAASVLVLFGEHADHGPDVLLLRRADTLGSHAGQVAFPGGGAEEGDDGPIGTALREAEEETGVEVSGIRPVALLPRLYIPVSRFAVTPVLAHWAEPSPVHAVDPGETAAVARVPVAELADPANRFLVRSPDGRFKGPAFTVGELFVWGFTAGVLSALLRLGGWERPWDDKDVRDLDVAWARHMERGTSRE
ncbi:coenzyme A pyrophosphatase [Saccharomonospora sp. CUA-673]|uniref:NUDIX hydrolase n=1 Tax=Saccharomonospora sp. CUA-673 TaxID=1904969 RepID=UPI00096424FE|nr:CoA pyrophosphatase [Saccharomonospora sp. CUA-673]OLT48416.1 coenzyme A pyrophosphatase [Saccharomonospora sp. CUA-673]